MYKKGSLKIKYKHLKTILQMDKVQKEQQSKWTEAMSEDMVQK